MGPVDDDRIDLTPLDPTADAERWERMVASIMERARPELERRAGLAAAWTPLALLSTWARPTLATAALIAIAATGLLLWAERGAAPAEAAGAPDDIVLAEALDVPGPLQPWLIGDHEPTVTDLLTALERRAP